MSDTFEHAELTTSALRFDDGCSGFLRPRLQHFVAIPFQTTDTEGSQGWMSLRLETSQELDGGTSNTRGWVFQERLLLRRILTFTNKTKYFECRSVTRS
jgi:hypothetical protein